jgi:long-chain-fatty-acid--CoA ligase ACSBG
MYNVMCFHQSDTDPDTGTPRDQLADDTLAWCRSLGSSCTTVSELVQKRESSITKAVQASIDQANKKAVSRAANIQKWSILPRDFSIPGGELGTVYVLQKRLLMDFAFDVIFSVFIKRQHYM